MKFLLLFLICFNCFATDIEENFPDNHPSRSSVITQLFSSITQSIWQWQRDGIRERRENCYHWNHDGARDSTCLVVEGQKHTLIFWGDYIDEVLEFVAAPGVEWSLDELLSFDSVLMSPNLEKFSSKRTGILFEYSPGKIHFKTRDFGGYEFFSLVTDWGEHGLRQEIFGRCSTCSGKRFRSYLTNEGGLEYRASHLSGTLSPSIWNGFMSEAYTYVLSDMASKLDFFTP